MTESISEKVGPKIKNLRVLDNIPRDDAQVIQAYKKVLDKSIRSFPKGTWGVNTDTDKETRYAFHRFEVCTRYLIEEHLKLSLDQVPKAADVKLFREYGLLTPLRKLCNENTYTIISRVYPQIDEWEMRDIHDEMFYDPEQLIAAVRWLINKKLKLNREQILNKEAIKLFKNNNWGSIPLWYAELVEFELFAYHEGFAAIDLIIDAFPEYGFNEREFINYRRYMSGQKGRGRPKKGVNVYA